MKRIFSKYTAKMLLVAGLVYASNQDAIAGNEERSGQAGASELLINPWARTSGSADANVGGVSGLEATFLNVAGLARLGTDMEIGFSTVQWIGDIDINTGGFARRISEDGVIAATISSWGFGDILRTTEDNPGGDLGTFSPTYSIISLSYAKNFTPTISGGVTMRVLSESTPNLDASGITLDIGVQYVSGENNELKFGITLKNIGPKLVFSGDGDDIRLTNQTVQGVPFQQAYEHRMDPFEVPSLLSIGGSYDFILDEDNVVTSMATFTSNSFTKDNVNLAAEWSFKSSLMLRAGYRLESDITADYDDGRTNALTGMTAGASYIFSSDSGKAIAIDYSYRGADPLASVHNLGLRLEL